MNKCYQISAAVDMDLVPQVTVYRMDMLLIKGHFVFIMWKHCMVGNLATHPIVCQA